MNKTLGIVIGAVAAVGVIASVVAGGAMAQGATPGSQTAATATPPAPAGPPRVARAGGMSDVANLLGMTVDEVWAARVQGKTLADLAKEKGVDSQKLVDALVASQKTMVDQAVTDNRLTQAQADKWLAWYQQSAELQLTEPYGPGFGGALGGMRGGPGGPGGRGGMHLQFDLNGGSPPQPLATPAP